MTTIGYIVGSLSKNSINRTLAKALIGLAPEGVEFREIEIGALPLYNHDLDGDYPAVATDFKAAVEGVDALMIVTPEYNRSIPGALKNALDWGSRPWGTNSFAGLSTGIIGASPSGIGSAMAQQHLRNILSFLDVAQMSQPEAYINFRAESYGPDGEVTEDGLREVLTAWVQAFVTFAERHPKA